MNRKTISEVVQEIAGAIRGRRLGKIFQLSPLSFALDFRLGRGTYLFIDVDPKAPRIHLIERRVKDIERQSLPHLQFAQLLRGKLSGATADAFTQDSLERVVRLGFVGEDETGEPYKRSLLAQLTGRSANLFLLDSANRVLLALRPPKGKGQQPGDVYQPPAHQSKEAADEENIESGAFASASAAVDAHYANLERAEAFAARAKLIENDLRRQATQRTKLRNNLMLDLESHGDAEKAKRYGDLLLANLLGAKRSNDKVKVTDYYSEGTPEIEIEVDEHSTLQEAAAKYFQRYTKAKRAAQQIKVRLAKLEDESAALREQQQNFEKAKVSGDESQLARFEGPKLPVKSAQKKTEKIAGVRYYRSSDGYEILAGRTARINDQLTFRIARPNDMWFHAADYPGSHVVIRNTSRTEIPQRTIIEAAQLAAKFSQAGKDSKVVIHYTPRKFLSKPKGAAPGLVRMSRVRSITVEPREEIERI